MGSRRTWADNVYKAASKWVDSALRTDDSLFTPGEPIWSSQWLGELHERFLNHPDESQDTFIDKLKRQLANSPPEVYQLMGEILYVYFLIVYTDNSDGEQETIKTALGWAPSPVAIPPGLAAGLDPGLINPGQGFHAYRPFQVGFIIEFAEQWKEQSDECIPLLDDPWGFKNFLHNIPLRSRLFSDGGNQHRMQREAILHLVFPDTFEAITSFGDKEKIVDTFADHITEPTSDVDHKLAQIRSGLEPEHGSDFNFYDAPVKDHWKGQSPAIHQLINTVKRHLVIDPEGGNAFTIEGIKPRQRRSRPPRWKGISRADRIALVDSAIAEFTGGTDTSGAAELVAVDEACKSYHQRLIDKLGDGERGRDTLADDWADLRKTLMTQVDGPKVPRGVLPVLAVDLQALAGKLLFDVDSLQKIEKLLDDKRQVIFQGPPGTGKTFVARKLAACLAGSKGYVRLVQFHPSYAYEDFVQGYRPALIDGQPGFDLRNGPLLEAAEQARAEPDANHFLVIDEINRGNLSKVFGELYFLLEYRDEEMRLLYADEPFSLPDNLYIIGTMNTADRSIALVDLALRRRFHFVEFHPDTPPVQGLLRRWLEQNAPTMSWVADIVDRANEKLDDQQAAIGPSYFMQRGLNEEKLRLIWKHNVRPYIEEHLYGEHDRLGEFDLDTLRREAEQDGVADANGPTNADD